MFLRISPRLPTLPFLFSLVLLLTTATRAQESNLVVPTSFIIPVPKPEPSKKSYPSGRSRFALDRQSLRFGLIQGGAELYDGFTTRYFVHRCYPCTEPIPRLAFFSALDQTGPA